MPKKQTKKKGRAVKPTSPPPPKDFLDMIAPAAVKFNTDSYILGGAYHCTLALRGYPTTTEELALLRHLGEKSGVTLRIYARQVTAAEENAILHNATNRSRMERGNTNDMKQSITAEANLQDVAALITTMHRNREPLEHCAVFIELSARDADGLRSLRDDVTAELTRSKLNADRVLLRQREGFLASNPAGNNVFGSLYERVLPASSVANLYPFNYSGKNDPTIEYIRNTLKRVRKKESSLILASQNLEDFDVDGIRELTRPLFAIPTHQFLFNAGSVDKRFYMDNLQLEESEFELIRYPQQGVCLYKCGNERYLLEVKAPPHKAELFGKAGGR